MTKKDMQAAAEIVKQTVQPEQKMLVAESFVDLFIATNERFNLMRFLGACGITEGQWNKERVTIYKTPKYLNT